MGASTRQREARSTMTGMTVGTYRGHRVLDDEEVMGGGAGPLGSVPPACFCVASTYHQLLSPSPCFSQSLPDHLDDRGPPRLWDPA